MIWWISTTSSHLQIRFSTSNEDPNTTKTDTLPTMSLQNTWHHRRVADTSAKACFICYKPSTSVLITPDNKVSSYLPHLVSDIAIYIYIYINHYTDGLQGLLLRLSYTSKRRQFLLSDCGHSGAGSQKTREYGGRN